MQLFSTDGWRGETGQTGQTVLTGQTTAAADGPRVRRCHVSLARRCFFVGFASFIIFSLTYRLYFIIYFDRTRLFNLSFMGNDTYNFIFLLISSSSPLLFAKFVLYVQPKLDEDLVELVLYFIPK